MTKFVHHDFYHKYVKVAGGERPGLAMVTGARVWPGRTDDRKLFEMACGVDIQSGPGVDIVHDLEQHITPWPKGTFNHVLCCSVLEHVKRPWLAATNIEDALVFNGTIQLAVPFVWRIHGYPSDYWRFTPEAIKVLFPRIEWTVTKFHYNNKFHDKWWVDKSTPRLMPRTEVHMFGHKKEA